MDLSLPVFARFSQWLAKLIIFLICFHPTFSVFSQDISPTNEISNSASPITPTSTPELEKVLLDRHQLRENSSLKNYPARNIGPTEPGGRITAIAVHPQNKKIFFVAYASGGLFKTTNNGQSFDPVFDGQGCLGIGHMTLSPSNPDIIWVGTGESNSSRSSYAGCGVYKSLDGGKTWEHKGLTGTQHISKVIVHPTNPDIVWVASIGALYSANSERGVFKTTDGGLSWNKNLFIDDRVGIIDLIIDPGNPDKLLAASWERSRKAWNFDEDGPGSGIWLSNDGGESWDLSMEGFPKGEHTGRIGLAIAKSDPQVLYAFLDHQAVDSSLIKEDSVAGLCLSAFAQMTATQLLSLRDSQLDSFLKRKDFPEKYTAKQVKMEVKAGKYTPKALNEYFGDANLALFQTGVKGAELYRSNDGGQTWTLQHKEALKGVYYSYGYYFGMIRVAPDDADRIYVAGVPLLASSDGGQKWERLDTLSGHDQWVHVDHHELWIDPQDSDHLILGNDGGLYRSFDRGAHWDHINNLPVGQFYTVTLDNEKPYNVYGGLQDNGVWMGSSKTIPNYSVGWKRLFGGDGMYVYVDPQDRNLLYTGYQFGNYFRIDQKQNKTEGISPEHDIGAEKYRFNWRTPLIGSPHNHEILYMGSQFLFRSLDKGENWEALSEDLTSNRQPQGNVAYSTLTDISESPLKFGLIWAGTDDGRVHLTTDGGNSWIETGEPNAQGENSWPAGLWVSKILASPHDKSTAFVTLNGYREDHFEPYIFQTTDMGKTWKSLVGNLPQEVVNVVLQDPIIPELLFCGTDHGTFLSFDQGGNWAQLGGIPNVASYDMAIHLRDSELVVATHGRSIYVVDLTPIRKIARAITISEHKLIAFELPAIKRNDKWGLKNTPYDEPKKPSIKLSWFINFPLRPNDVLEIKIENEKGKELRHWRLSENEIRSGYGELFWDLRVKKDLIMSEKGRIKRRKNPIDMEEIKDNEELAFLPVGKYKLYFEVAGNSTETELVVTDPATK